MNVTANNSTAGRLKKYGLFGRVGGRKPLQSKKNLQAQLWFAEARLNEPQDSGTMSYGQVRPGVWP